MTVHELVLELLKVKDKQATVVVVREHFHDACEEQQEQQEKKMPFLSETGRESDKWTKERTDREREPPGKHVWQCPRCGKIAVVRVPTVTW